MQPAICSLKITPSAISNGWAHSTTYDVKKYLVLTHSQIQVSKKRENILLWKRESVQIRVIILAASRGEFPTNFACTHEKRAELTTPAFCFRVQQAYDKINLEESAAFEITTENGETNTKNEPFWLQA